jgi:hypothetical protein
MARRGAREGTTVDANLTDDWLEGVGDWIEEIDWDENFKRLHELRRGLGDLRLQTAVTTAMAPTVYVLGAGGVLALNAYLTLKAFRQSFVDGVIQIVFAPFLFLAGVIAVRVILEAMLSLFRINVRLDELMLQLDTLRGQTSAIADRVDDLPLPRVQFFRSRKR